MIQKVMFPTLFRMLNKASMIGKNKAGVELYREIASDGAVILRSFKAGKPLKTVVKRTGSGSFQGIKQVYTDADVLNHVTGAKSCVIKRVESVDAASPYWCSYRNPNETGMVLKFDDGTFHSYLTLPETELIYVNSYNMGKYENIYLGQTKDGAFKVLQEHPKKSGSLRGVATHYLNDKPVFRVKDGKTQYLRINEKGEQFWEV